MEYWSVEKKDIHPLAITPTLQYSNAPKLIGIESTDVLWYLLASSYNRVSENIFAGICTLKEPFMYFSPQTCPPP